MKSYYIYIWYNDDWGGIPVYVGKGKDNRYCIRENRSIPFINHLNRWHCHSEIILDGLDEDGATRLEKKIKDGFIIEGYPILDAETSYRKKVSQAVSIRRAKARGVKFGRPHIDVDDDFEKFLEKQKRGEISVKDCCKALNISRSTWYNRVAEVG